MKVSRELLKKLEELYSQYEKEIPNTKNIYLLHNNNFMSWLKHDFESGEKDK